MNPHKDHSIDMENQQFELHQQLRTIRLEPEWLGLDNWIYGA